MNTELDLFLRIAKGDEAAFTCIYKQYYAEIYYFTKRMVDEDIAKDIVVEVFTKLWKNPPRFESSGHLLSYLRKASRNACIDRLRDAKVEAAKQKELLQLSDDKYEEVYFRDVLEARFFGIINNEIEKLPGQLKSIFKLAYYEGLKNSEIVERLHLKDSTVRVGKAEAIKLLRMRLLNTDLPVMLLCVLLL